MAITIDGSSGVSANLTLFLVGQVCHFAQTTAPSGFIVADGSAISRTTYADLFTAIGTNYGVGDGTTTFNLPNLQGEFIRGYDNAAGNDPDAATRTDRGDGTTGDVVGSKQASEFAQHLHNTSVLSSNGGGALGAYWSNLGGSPAAYGANTDNRGGNETRPRNVAMLPTIFTGVV